MGQTRPTRHTSTPSPAPDKVLVLHRKLMAGLRLFLCLRSPVFCVPLEYPTVLSFLDSGFSNPHFRFPPASHLQRPEAHMFRAEFPTLIKAVETVPWSYPGYSGAVLNLGSQPSETHVSRGPSNPQPSMYFHCYLIILILSSVSSS